MEYEYEYVEYEYEYEEVQAAVGEAGGMVLYCYGCYGGNCTHVGGDPQTTQN